MEADSVPRLDALETLLGSTTVQRYGTPEGAGSIGRVIAARVTPDGRHVAVADFVAPYLRVFDRSGRPTHQAVARGGGPAELRAVGALAVTDDRALLLGPDGLLVASLAPSGAAARVTLAARLLDIGTDCGGRVVGYGPDASGTEPSFVHVVSVDSQASLVTSVYPDSRPQRLSWGHGRAGITGGSNGSTVLHRLPAGVRLIFLDCSGTVQERPWAWAVPRFPSQQDASAPGMERRGDAVAVTLNAADPILRGAGELPDGTLLWLEGRVLSRAPLTYFYHADATGTHGGHVHGSYSLHDVAASGVLLSTPEPYPSVLLVPWEELRSAIRQGRAFPRPRGE